MKPARRRLRRVGKWLYSAALLFPPRRGRERNGNLGALSLPGVAD